MRKVREGEASYARAGSSSRGSRTAIVTYAKHSRTSRVPGQIIVIVIVIVIVIIVVIVIIIVIVITVLF